MDLTRERIRQIKARSARRIYTHIPHIAATCALYNHATHILQAENGKASPGAVKAALDDGRVLSPSHRWLLAWFNDIYGSDSSREALQPKSRWESASGAKRYHACGGDLYRWSLLRLHGYCPLTLDDALAIAWQTDPSITAQSLRAQLADDPEVQLFTYGSLQIGHSTWKWFDAKRNRDARQVEWALRLTHKPASPVDLVELFGTASAIGRLRLSPSPMPATPTLNDSPAAMAFMVSLSGKLHKLWLNRLQESLTGNTVSFLELLDQWPKYYGDQPEPELLLAALYTNPDRFHPVRPPELGTH